MNEQIKINSLYSSKQDPDFEKYMSLLFPFDQEEYTNFGYWKDLHFPNSIGDIAERIASQRNLYKHIHDLLNVKSKDRILEVGCGKGYGVKQLCESGTNCFGIDATEDQIKACKLRHEKYKDNFILSKAESLPFEEKYFKGLYSIEAAQHFTNFENFCSEAFRVLRQSGRICITTFFLITKTKKKDIDRIIPPTVEGTDNIISIEFALDCLRKTGFKDLSCKAIGKYVFPQFACWQKLVIKSLGYPKPPKDKIKWTRYYSMDEKSTPHPWLEAYQKQFVDYFVITSNK